MKFNLLLLISLLLVNVSKENSVQCDGETIDKCTKCNSGDNSDSCAACEDKTFLFFHNLVCLPCNNSLYGQIGCGGKCNGTNFTKYGKIECEEGGCIDGYYRTEFGYCNNCSSRSPHCSKCSYEIPENGTYYEFKCLKCESDEYILDQYGNCNNCTMDFCEKCKFAENRTKTVCEKCKDGYDINKYGECDHCYNDTYTYYSMNKICYQCNHVSEPEYCWCEEGYYENPENPSSECLRCPNGCEDCIFNAEKNKTECNKCSESYAINPEKECQFCNYRCKSCKIDEKENPICSSCEDGYSLDKDNFCRSCGYACLNCEFDEYYNPLCLNCKNGYAINPQKSCHECDEGCLSCIINEEFEEEDYICTSCSNGYALNPYKQCIKCEDECLSCEYDEKGNSLCTNCSYGYSLSPDKKCVKCEEGCLSCEYDEKGNSLCLECQSEYLISLNKTCLKCANCEAGHCSIDENNNPTCSYCDWHYTLYNGQCFRCPDECRSYCKIDESSEYKNETICTQCNYGYVLNPNNNLCYACDSFQENGEGCESCFYKNDSKKFECYSCKGGYYSSYLFISNKKQCIDIYERNLTELERCHTANFNEKTKKYECSECKDGYIFIVNDNICKSPSEIDLSYHCKEAESIKTETSTKYTCLSCPYNYLNISLGSTGIVDCYDQSGNYSACLEGTADENRQSQKCTKCAQNAELNASNICNCVYDSFNLSGSCFKCDDPIQGNIECLASKGCSFKGSLYCNECKDGYYNNSFGECSSCSEKIPNCEKCHLNISIGIHNETIENIICDSCSALYTLKTENTTQKCELNECKEYPEISPGCIICKDKLNEYKSNNKCQTCKYGYFKTKDDLCIYCRSEQYGGPACYECGYELDKTGKETDNIICKNCYSFFAYNYLDEYYNRDYENKYFTSVLSEKKKCYNCQYELSDLCLKCKFETDDKELKCNLCPPGYYIDSDGNCINFADKVETLPNCNYYRFIIGNYNFTKSDYDINYGDNIEYVNLKEYNDALSNAKSPISSNCTGCDEGYILNKKGECEYYDYNKCTGKYILEDLYPRLSACEDLCTSNYMIYVKFENNSMDLNPENYNNMSLGYSYYDIRSIDNILRNYFNVTNNLTQDFILNSHICLDSSDEKIRNRYSNCERILYIPSNKTFNCLECNYPYKLATENNTCYYNRTYTPPIEDKNCEYENLGTNETPIYSCVKCYNDYYTLLTDQNGIKTCVNDIYEIDECKEATITSTYYIDTVYNCTSCRYYYWPYYSKYYDRHICQHIIDNIVKSNNISLDIYEDENEDDIIPAKSGSCDSGYFTPDGKKCYKCDSKIVGMPGCSGECSFSTNRFENLKCESECKEGYIEESKGICIPCKDAKRGCASCHYETNYPKDYIGKKRERFVQCDKCDKGFTKSEISDDCFSCGSNCDECERSEKFYEEYNTTLNVLSCTKCSKYYFLEEGECTRCIATKAVSNNKCKRCSEEVNNCRFCESKEEGDGIKCKECDEDYVLNSGTNTCLKREGNKDLEQFKNCLEFNNENGKNVCVRCKPQFSLLKEGDEVKCSYLPTLFDSNYGTYYHDYYTKKYGYYGYYYSDKMRIFMENDYYLRQGHFMPCKEAVNLGTAENPLYSCSKCYDVFGNEDEIYYSYYYDDFYSPHSRDAFESYRSIYVGYMPVKINDQMTNTSYCMRFINDTNHCAEATYKIENGKEIFNCTKCANGFILTYKEKRNIFICKEDINGTNNNDKSNQTGTKSDVVDTKTDESTHHGDDTKSDAVKSDAVKSDAVNSDATKTDEDKKTDSSNLDEDPYVDPYSGQCFVLFCQTCLSTRSYYCSVCQNNTYEVNNASGSCVEKTPIPPAISFVDIFGYTRRKTKVLNNRAYTGPSLKLRGITCSRVNARHAFIIILVYILRGRLRNLEDNLLRIPAICEIENSVLESDDSIKSINYDCIGRQEVGDNYELYDIEGDYIDDNFLKNVESYNKSETTFKEDSVILFTIDDVANITSNNNIFDFTLAGTLFDKNNKLSDSKNVQIEMKERTEKTICDFIKGSNQNANLDCTLSLSNTNIKKHIFSFLSRKDSKGVIDMTFKDNLIKINNNDVYINKLNEIHLIQDPNYATENEYIHYNKKSSGSSNKALIISLSVVLGVIVIGAVVALAIYLLKVRNTRKNVIPENNSNSMTVNNMVNDFSNNRNN